MNRIATIAAGGATLAAALAPSAALAGSVSAVTPGARSAAAVTTPAARSAAAPVSVSVRIEGSSATLLATRAVTAPAGSITKGGAPAGACPGDSAAGALEAATHGDWGGSWYSSFHDYLINSVLGDAPNAKTGYWGIWVDDAFATKGACDIALKPGEQLLFAVDSLKHHEHPLGISGPADATAGRPFTVSIVAYSDAGRAAALKRTRVSFGGLKSVTSARGTVSLTAEHTGPLELTVSAAGYIRSATLTVKVAH